MKKFRFGSILFALILVFSFVLSACGGGSATVSKIEVTKLPKTEYIVGETLDFTGGELTATYSDGTEAKVSLTDSEVTITKVNMGTVGEKVVSVTYQSKSTTYKVKVSEAKLVVTYDLNYEGAPTATTEEVDKGETVSAPADPTRTGFAFLGWYVAADGNTKYNFASAITQNVTIYAHWGYSVEFNKNYEGATNDTQVVGIGEKVARPTTNPEREGYLFTDWFTTTACETEYNFDAAINQNTVIYAGWQEVSTDTTLYTVTFVYNDGAGTTLTRQVVENQAVVAPTPTLQGVELLGWYTDEECTAEYVISTPVTADITLYAGWSKGTSYSVTFHWNHANNNGVYSVLEKVFDNGRASKPETDPALDGFYFAGWYEDADCTTEFSFTSTRIHWFTHLYAKWQKEWEFQAEDTDFGEREAFGYSANGRGAAAFIMKKNAEMWGAHNGHWVANLHHVDLFVEFIIDSDEEVFDAALVLRLSCDFYAITLNKDSFEIKVNDEVIDYDYEAKIEYDGLMDVDNKRPFDNWDFGIKMHLVKGRNYIRFTMTEERKYGEFGTMYATAPMMDSIYVCTNANLSMTTFDNY